MDIEFALEGWLIVVVATIGALVVVHAYKMFERYRESRERKLNIFGQLIATRSTRLTRQHMRALNMIDQVFNGRRSLGGLRRSSHEHAVLVALKEYRGHPADYGSDESVASVHDELYTQLLYAIARDVGLSSMVQLKNTTHAPIEHRVVKRQQGRPELRLVVSRGVRVPQPKDQRVAAAPLEPGSAAR